MTIKNILTPDFGSAADLSFTNILTYQKNQYLRDVVKYTPLKRILIETDAPFLPPDNKRGQTSEPKDVINVARIIAETKNVSLETVEEQLFENTNSLFQLGQR